MIEAAAREAAPRAAVPAPPPRIAVAPYSYAQARTLARELGVSHTLAQALVRRGLGDPAAAAAFLAADEEHDPGTFGGMDSAVALILGHLGAGARITVHGDYDADGVCATALLVRVLRALTGAAEDRVDWLLPSRLHDGYGLSASTVARLARRGTGLLITVDCAITAVEEVAAARRAGMDVLVCDHHAPRGDGALPDAAILHPGVCGYPFTGLCGTGVAHKLAQALVAAAGAPPELAARELDLVALATVADLVSLTGENRRLVRAGLRALQATTRPGLAALMAQARLDPGLVDAAAVAFRLAPRINAAGRLARADAAVELLLTDQPARARAIAAELDEANAARRAIEREITWQAEGQVAAMGERPAYVVAGEGWHPGVVGIVAARLVERHHRPALAIALPAPGPVDAGALATGSGRSIPAFDLLAALDAVAGELAGHGGHRAAAGLTVDPERVPALRAAFEAHAAAVLEPAHLVPTLRVDAVVGCGALDLALAEELTGALEPCGMGNPPLNLMVTGAQLTDPRPMGEGGHVRFALDAGSARARGVAFGCGGRLPVPAGEPCRAVVRLERHEWGGVVEPRLLLVHAARCAPDPIEVVGEPPDGPGWVAAALAELEVPLDPPAPGEAGRREVVDRRGAGPGAVLADLVGSGEPVLALCADVPRRLDGLAARAGGFALCSWTALEREPARASGRPHLVALDPPSHGCQQALACAGAGHLHLAWGEAETAFAERVHERDWRLREPLVDLYRALGARGEAHGPEVEEVLRGDGPRPRPAALAGRLLRVLCELELIRLQRDGPKMSMARPRMAQLERSAAWRAYTQRYEDGRRYLSSARTRLRA